MKSPKIPQPIEGAPNFRGLPGMPIFGTGMPTIEGIVAVLKVSDYTLCVRAIAAVRNSCWFVLSWP